MGGGGGQMGVGAAGQMKMPGKRVYVGNLSWDVKWQDLKDHMRKAGEVIHADVMVCAKPATRNPKPETLKCGCDGMHESGGWGRGRVVMGVVGVLFGGTRHALVIILNIPQ